MKESKLKKLLRADNEEVALANGVRAQLCWSTQFVGLRWCVLKVEQCRIPKWQFWRVRFSHCQMYGPFPSRNQAVKFANYLANPV